MKNIWSVVCSRSVVDQRTNALSLYDCIDEMTIGFAHAEDINKDLKNIPLAFEVVSLWHDEEINKERFFDYLIEIIDPKNKKISEFSNKAKFEKNKKRLRTITQINGVSLTIEGEYLLKIKYQTKGENFIKVSEIPIDVKFLLNIPNQK